MACYNEEDLLPLSGIQHFAYCPRQWALIHVENQWVENLGTAQGRIVHQRVDDPCFSETRGATKTERSIPLISQKLGLFGIADLLEIHKQQENQVISYSLVEYKRGKPKPDDRDEVQLCAQAMCLEEMRGKTVNTGYIYYDMIKNRHNVVFTDTLRRRVEELATAMHAYYTGGITPAAVKSRKCKNCSMEGVCMPKLGRLNAKAKSYIINLVREMMAEQ